MNVENKMSVRRANRSDLYVVMGFAVRIVAQHLAYNPVRFAPLPRHTERLRDYFLSEISSDTSAVLLLQLNREIIGFALVKVEEENLEDIAGRRAWLADIFIDDLFRGAGGGRLLLDAAKTAAADLGCKILMLHVATANKRARKFFDAHQFRETMTEMMFTAGKDLL